MNDWNDGYFTSDTYTYGYYRELSPTYQNFVLLLRGFAPPEPHEGSVHCELGFGQGVAANIHAASTLGQFYGTDFNSSHAAHANELCAASQCGAHFFDDSFEQMLNRNDLPQFDSISLHGIWSWISTENQNIIVEFARKFLKSGGILYNSYNCFPGWAAKAPLRELLILYDKFVGETDSNTHSRVEAALKFAEDLLATGTLYAKSAAGVEETLKGMRKDDHHYLAHEFFNRDWICMYFTDVVEILSNAKLDFACTAESIEAIDQAHLTPDSIQFLSKIGNPIMKEQTRDYFINRQFRKDLYIRGARKLSEAERRQRLLNTKFVLMTVDKPELKYRSTLGEVGFNNPGYDKVIDYLRSDDYRPKKFADLLAKDPSVNFENVEQAVTVLSSLDKLMPCQTDQAIEQVKSRCDRLNEYLCKRAEVSDNVNQLASPVIGGGLLMSRFDQIFTRLYQRGTKSPKGMADYAWKVIDSQGQRLIKDGKAIEDAEGNLAEFKELANTFLSKKLPILRALQII